jgi:heme O synthase-like polyprenyltransferase
MDWKKILAKEYLILLSIVSVSAVLAYLLFPIWRWNDYTRESSRIFDWELFKISIISLFLLRLLIISVKTLRSK